MERRVVVTGMGAVSCAGNSVPALWDSLTAGRSGIGPITLFDAADLPCPAGEVRDFVLPPDVTPKEARRMARNTRFAVAAAGEAMTAARLGRTPAERGGDPFRFGVFMASGAGGVDVYDRSFETLAQRGPNGVSPFFMPTYIVNAAGGVLAIRWGLRGPNFDPASACASGAHAIGEAVWTIRRGDADLMLAGGTEASITRLFVSGFYALTALSGGTPPEKACRPFDLHRDGFVLSEGAGALVLEELEHARKRGAPILAEVAGYGASCDATHITAPDPTGEGLAYAIRRALDMAGCAPAEVGAVYAHGTGTAANDRAEAKSFGIVFGDAGIVDHRVRRVVGKRRVQRPPRPFAVADIEFHDPALPPQLLHFRRQAPGVFAALPARRHDIEPVPRQTERDLPSDAAAAADNEGGTSFLVHHLSSHRLKIKAALWPPNPRASTSTVPASTLAAPPGLTSRAHSGSGVS